MRANRHALGGFGGGQAGADRKAAAERLGERHDIRLDADTLIAEQRAGAAHAGLHLVEHEQQAVLVAELAQRPEKRRRRHSNAALAHDRFDQDRRRFRPDRALGRLEIAERHLIEAVDRRTEAFEIFLVAARRRASPGCGRGTRRQSVMMR